MRDYSGRFWSSSVETTSSCDVEPDTPAVKLTGSEIVRFYSVLKACQCACKNFISSTDQDRVKCKLSFWSKER